LPLEFQDGKHYDVYELHEETQDEKQEGGVVAFADARAEPHAMVVELGDANVAQVAVRCLVWSKNETCFAELHPCYRCLRERGFKTNVS